MSRKSVMIINDYPLILIYPLIWCAKVVNAPCLGDRIKQISEHWSIKYSSKCNWIILGEKKTYRVMIVITSTLYFVWLSISQFIVLSWSFPGVSLQFYACLKCWYNIRPIFSNFLVLSLLFYRKIKKYRPKILS